MSKTVPVLTRSVLSLAFIVLVAASHAVFAQSELTGEWKASINQEKSDKIYLSLERRSDNNGKNQMGSSYDFADLQGLSREQASSGGPVRFSLVREAGTIQCEGSFQNGKGSGTFRFTGNQSFVSAMKTRGFDFEKTSSATKEGRGSENRLFAATTLNVTTALADDLLSAGFANLDVDDLFKAAIFKVDSKFMREMKASGFPNLGMEELVKARIFKIDADFVTRVTQLGFDKESFESLVKMRIFKVTPEFITAMRNEGLTELSVEDLVKMRIFNIDSAFIRQAKAEGVPLDVEKLVQKRIGARSMKFN
ncbi:MAG TPA: hypothetical protein VM934_16625 [Pyrinomonadaceae bacterium]|jgi:hypothetical protein|nr:hypothetical protein [Pyrinomonadaceae bacterium]